MPFLSTPDLSAAVGRLIDTALAEDIGPEDVTSARVIPESLAFKGVIAAREAIVVAGLPFAAEVFARVVPDATFSPRVDDGDGVSAGTVLAVVEGPARGLLTAERTALNLLAHLSGIATLTRTYVEAITGTGAVLLDTRKTIPGLRQVAKYASRLGGARNHRMGLYDGILIKDNHVAVCGSITEAVRRARGNGEPVEIEIECDTLEQVAEAVAAEVDIILLDNMSQAQLRQAVAMIAGRARSEASGGVTLESIRAIAETGVDFVSVGRLTQSARAVDIGLDWERA
jgi:nicotinate-nucleotide pyrophosphorylase (carboxylating)